METYLAKALATILSLLGSGGAVWALAAVVKRLKAIPINEGQKTRIRALAAVLSAVAVCLGNLAEGSLVPENLQALLIDVVQALSVWFVAHAAHKELKAAKSS